MLAYVPQTPTVAITAGVRTAFASIAAWLVDTVAAAARPDDVADPPPTTRLPTPAAADAVVTALEALDALRAAGLVASEDLVAALGPRLEHATSLVVAAAASATDMLPLTVAVAWLARSPATTAGTAALVTLPVPTMPVTSPQDRAAWRRLAVQLTRDRWTAVSSRLPAALADPALAADRVRTWGGRSGGCAGGGHRRVLTRIACWVAAGAATTIARGSFGGGGVGRSGAGSG